MTTGMIVLLCAGIFIPVGWYMALLFVLPRLNEKDASIDKLLRELLFERNERDTLAGHVMRYKNSLKNYPENAETTFQDIRTIIDRINEKKPKKDI